MKRILGRLWLITVKGRFPLSRNFSVRKHVKFTYVNEIEAMYERLRVKVKVERVSTFTYTRDLPYAVSILFTRVKFPCVRTEKLYATVEIYPGQFHAMFLRKYNFLFRSLCSGARPGNGMGCY